MISFTVRLTFRHEDRNDIADILRKLTRLATPLDLATAALDCVLRPAFLDLEGPREGYAISLYVKALGGDQHAACKEWGEALDAVVALIRSKDFAR